MGCNSGKPLRGCIETKAHDSDKRMKTYCTQTRMTSRCEVRGQSQKGLDRRLHIIDSSQIAHTPESPTAVLGPCLQDDIIITSYC